VVHETGARSLKIDAGDNGEVMSDFIPVDDFQLYRFEINWATDDVANGIRSLVVWGYDESKALLGGSVIGAPTITIANNTFTKERHYFYPFEVHAGGVRYVKIELGAVSTTSDVWIDYVVMTAASHQFRAYRNNAQAIPSGVVTGLRHTSVDFELGDLLVPGPIIYGIDDSGGAATMVYRCLVPGQYYAFASVTLDTLSANKTIETGFEFNGVQTNTGTVRITGNAGDHQIMAATIVTMEKDDELSHYVYHDEGVPVNTIGGLLKTHFQVGPVSGDG